MLNFLFFSYTVMTIVDNGPYPINKINNSFLNTSNISQILTQLMKHFDVDDRKLAKATGVARTNITRLRLNPKANPTAATIIPLAKFFNISVGQLIGAEELIVSDINLKKAQQIPIIDWCNIEEYIEGNRDTPNYKLAAHFVPASYNISHSSFCLHVETEADELIMRKSSLVIIDPQKQYNHLNIVLARIVDKTQFVKIIIENQKLFFKHLSTKCNEIHEFNDCIHKIIGTLVEIKYIF